MYFFILYYHEAINSFKENRKQKEIESWVCLCKFLFYILVKFSIFLSNQGGPLLSEIIFLFGIKLLMICKTVSLDSKAWLLIHLYESSLSQSKAPMAFAIISLLALSYSHGISS